MMSRCMQEIKLNTTLQTSHTKEGKTFTEISGNKLCPGFTHACTNNGACRNGKYFFLCRFILFVLTVEHLKNVQAK